jgi:hypothetical protein
MSTEVPRGEQDEASIERWPIGRSILQRIRAEVNGESGPLGEPDEGEDHFRDLYLTARDTCIPEAFIGDELLADIHRTYYDVLDAVAVELRERASVREFLHIIIDPSYMDQTYFVIHTPDVVVLSGGIKCWNFWWESDEKMAEELQDWYERAASRSGRAEGPPKESASSRYEVTLNLERVLHVEAEDRTTALDRAVRWSDNENDPDVQLLYEEVTSHHVRPLPDEDIHAATSDPTGVTHPDQRPAGGSSEDSGATTGRGGEARMR